MSARAQLLGFGQKLEVSLTGGGIASHHRLGSRITMRDAQILAPWPNRIANGRYSFAGKHYDLPINEPSGGNAIHGLVRALPCLIHFQDETHLELTAQLEPSAGYPFALHFRIFYTLLPAGLAVEVHTTNRSTEACPYGIGMHPYFFFAGLAVDALCLHAPATKWIANDARNLPLLTRAVDATAFDFREPQLIGSRVLDNALTDFARDSAGEAICTVSGGGESIRVSFGSPYAQMYTSDTVPAHRQALAVEPMTCPANAFNSGEALVVLAAGATHVFAWRALPSS